MTGYDLDSTMAPLGSGSELDLRALRQVVLEGFAVLLTDARRMFELVRVQGNLPLNRRETEDAITADRVEILRRLLPYGQTNVYADEPDNERQIPLVGFKYVGEASEVSTHLGDIAAETDVTIGGRVYTEQSKGSYRRRSVTAAVLAATFEETSMLYAALWHVLEHDRARLYSLGLSDVVTTGTPPESQTVDDGLRFSQGTVNLSCTWLHRSVVLHGPRMVYAEVVGDLLGTNGEGP